MTLIIWLGGGAADPTLKITEETEVLAQSARPLEDHPARYRPIDWPPGRKGAEKEVAL